MPIGDLCAFDILDIPHRADRQLVVTIGILRPKNGLRMTRGGVRGHRGSFSKARLFPKAPNAPKTMVVLARPVICVKVFYLE